MTKTRALAVAPAVLGLAAATVTLAPSPAVAATGDYTFTVVADSVADDLDPTEFGCASINDGGDIAFRAGRPGVDGASGVDGIYRAAAGVPGLVTIAEDGERFDFLSNNPTLNDLGQVGFAAELENGGEAILRGSGGRLTRIAGTEPGRFNFFGFDVSINNDGRVAFKAELDEELDFDEGLFSGTGNAVATHYRASTSRFEGTDTRPSINDRGDIGFDEVTPRGSGVFVTHRERFRTVAGPDDENFAGPPVLNNAGIAAFVTSFTDPETEEFVTAIVSGRAEPLTTEVDTRGPFGDLGFRPPALSDDGDVAFHATLDDFTTSGVFTGPRPRRDAVLRTGDTLDGDTVTNVVFCEEGLNDADELALVVTLDDADAPEGSRTVVVRAAPVKVPVPGA